MKEKMTIEKIMKMREDSIMALMEENNWSLEEAIEYCDMIDQMDSDQPAHNPSNEETFERSPVNLRERVIHFMGNMIVNEGLHKEIDVEFDRVDKFLSNYIPRGSKADEEITGLIVELEDVCFRAGANMVLDFIAGKGVE